MFFLSFQRFTSPVASHQLRRTLSMRFALRNVVLSVEGAFSRWNASSTLRLASRVNAAAALRLGSNLVRLRHASLAITHHANRPAEPVVHAEGVVAF
jgi:hypothetical protein